MQVTAGDKFKTGILEETYQYNLHTYIGANAVALNFDGDTEKRFNFSDLHTPEYIGNNYNSGGTQGDPIADDGSDKVYKINKRLSGASYCPEMMPYNTDVETTIVNPAKPLTQIKIASTNWNLTQWTAIFDASSGILFKSFGGQENLRKHWHKCLWGILGFSYDQLNYKYVNDKNTNYKSRANLNTRINPENQGQTPDIFTNALVKTSDVSLFSTNMYGAQLFTQQGQSSGSAWNVGLLQHGSKATDIDAMDMNNPAISVQAQSIGIQADRQPTKMLRPYYLIKSNIVSDLKYIGSGHSTDGGQTLPIIGVVNKENGFGDYYFQTDQKAQFTITSDRTLTEIVTSIHDPDMSHSRVDKNSAVLYMITKQNNNNLNIIPSLLQTKQIPPAVLEPPVMTDTEYNTYFNSMIMTPQEQLVANEGFVQAHYDQGGNLVNALPDEQRDRAVQSFLGLRQGEPIGQMLGQAREGIGENDEVHNIPTQMTREATRRTEEFRGIQERAGVDMRRRFVPAGRSRPEQSGEMPGWYNEAVGGNDGSTLTPQSSVPSQSDVITAPSDPATSTAGSEASPQPDRP